MSTTPRESPPLGRLLTRREILALIGVSGAALFTRTASALAQTRGAPASCVVRPQQTEGPFFVDEGLERSDIRPDPKTGEVRPGAPLRLAFRVSRVRQVLAVSTLSYSERLPPMVTSVPGLYVVNSAHIVNGTLKNPSGP